MAWTDRQFVQAHQCREPGCRAPTTRRWGGRCGFHMRRHRRYGSAQAEPLPRGALRTCENEIRKGLALLPTEARSKLRTLARERAALLLEHSESHLSSIAEGGTTFHRHSGQVATWLRSLISHPNFRSWDFAIRLAAWYRLSSTQPRLFPTALSFHVRVVQNLLHLHQGVTTRKEIAHTSVKLMHSWIELYLLDVVAIMHRQASRHSDALRTSRDAARQLSRTLFPETSETR
jgi:hypothetical protein